jgi:tRNA dimethylallyltransferase
VGRARPDRVRRLRDVDPAAAGRIDLRNPRRVLRALERAEVAGAAVVPRATPYGGEVALVALDLPREVLYRRIDERARWMFEQGGLLDEVRRLLDAGFGPELRPMTGHGYREAAAHVSGSMSLEEAIDRTARRTRQYAKRQLSWFRRNGRIRWIAAAERPSVELAAEVDAALAPVFS